MTEINGRLSGIELRMAAAEAAQFRLEKGLSSRLGLVQERLLLLEELLEEAAESRVEAVGETPENATRGIKILEAAGNHPSQSRRGSGQLDCCPWKKLGGHSGNTEYCGLAS